MGSIGFDELLIVILVAIIVFGKDLPTVARKAATWYRKLKRHISDIREEIQRQIPEIEEENPVERLEGPLDPSRPATPASPAPESGSKPPDSPPQSAAGGAPPGSGA